MTEPSKEAAEALAQVMYAEPGNDPERKIAIAGLAAALPIELEKARNRWEQEVRERLLSDEVLAQMAEIFMWAVTTGPSHPEATPEKAIEQIIKPIRSKLATLNPNEGEGH